jgi:hypothetical protein
MTARPLVHSSFGNRPSLAGDVRRTARQPGTLSRGILSGTDADESLFFQVCKLISVGVPVVPVA